EDGREAVCLPLVLWKKVASGKEGLEVRREKQIVGRAAGAGQNLPRKNKGLVDIRALFPVHLDVDEPLIHQRGDRGIGVNRPLGDVTPVTSAVSDREEDQLILRPRCPNRLLAPWVPIHWVVG